VIAACTCVLSLATMVATTLPCTDRTQEDQIAELMTKTMQTKVIEQPTTTSLWLLWSLQTWPSP
jgi:hypothetical protein